MSADQELLTRIRNIIKPHFPEDTVDVSPGYHDNVHVVVMSRKFDNMGENEKLEFLWDILDKSDLEDEVKTRISLLLPLSPADVK